jgi:uncharacterized linocin/CFP29 family protein
MEVWDRVDQAVSAENKRAQLTAKFIPAYGPLPADTLTVPAQTVSALDPATPEIAAIDESAFVALTEVWVEFALTEQQVGGEEHLGTCVTLATRVTNLLSQAIDLKVFLGEAAKERPLFSKVQSRSRSNGVARGLLDVPSEANGQIVEITRAAGQTRYGERILGGIVEAISTLQRIEGGDGPYFVVLPTAKHADAHTPLTDTLITPALPIQALTKGFYGTGSLPEDRGLVVDLGGDSMDIVVAIPPTVAFMQVDNDGLSRFRVFSRFAFRLKVPTAVVSLAFR